jgi:hypothetical protein
MSMLICSAALAAASRLTQSCRFEASHTCGVTWGR